MSVVHHHHRNRKNSLKSEPSQPTFERSTFDFGSSSFHIHDVHRSKILDNGVTFSYVPTKGRNFAALYARIAAGSATEEGEDRGIQHFIEHILWTGTSVNNLRSVGEIESSLSRLGADPNAETGRESVAYFAKVPVTGIVPVAEIISHILSSPSFPKSSVKAHRGVIRSEILQSHIDPTDKAENRAYSALLRGTPFSHDPIGPSSNVARFSREKLQEYWKGYYHGSNITVTVCGDLDRKQVNSIAQLFEERIPNSPRSKRKHPIDRSTITTASQSRIISQRRSHDIASTGVCLAFPSFGIGDNRNPAADILSEVLGGSASSRLYTELREKHGLTYGFRAHNDPIDKYGIGIFRISGFVSTPSLKRILSTIIDEIDKLKRFPISDNELNIANSTAISSQLQSLEEPTELAERFADNLGMFGINEGKKRTIRGYLEAINRVSKGDIRSAAKTILNTDRMVISLVGDADPDHIAKLI